MNTFLGQSRIAVVARILVLEERREKPTCIASATVIAA
jgi:hypothetical protein